MGHEKDNLNKGILEENSREARDNNMTDDGQK